MGLQWVSLLPKHSSFSYYDNRIQVLNMHSLHGSRKNWDFIRTNAFVIFGALYTGGAQHFIFNFLHSAFDQPLARLAMAQFFFIPFCYYPTFLFMNPALRAGWEHGFGSEDAKVRQVELFSDIATAFGVIWNAILSWSTAAQTVTTKEV
eukprot:scaffold15292_cov111-Skeletonema_dohrnii-CCMP3373.AAC.3